jgi:antitoxin VapB
VAREWTAKSFKSGNSVALRLPKDLGIVEGDELTIVPHASGSFSLSRKQDTKNVFMALAGSMFPGFMKNGRGGIEQGPRAWDAPEDDRQAA